MSEHATVVPVVGSTKRNKLIGQKKSKLENTGRHDNLIGYLFVSPWLIGFFLFGLIPIVISLGLAFTNYDLLAGGNKVQFIGLNNFNRMFFQDPRYLRSVTATFIFVASSVPLRLIFALGVALLLNTKHRGVYWYRAAYYVPSIIGGSVAVAIMWRQLFGIDGVINAVLASLGVADINWLGNPHTAPVVLILLAVWQFGSPMLIFLAGLRQIPQELYEASAIDGANNIQKFFRVTLPLLTPVIFFNLVMQVIGGFKVFTQAFIITGGTGNPLDKNLFYALYLYQRAFLNYQMGYASAMAWVMLLIIAVLTLISFRLSRLWVFYETKEV